MQATTCDSKGRLYLKESVRSRYGVRFAMVQAPGELVLLPVPHDPVKDLGEIGRPLKGHTIKSLQQRILQRARREVVA